MANKISVIIDIAVDKATTSLGNLKTKLGEVDGAAAKFKVGTGAALDSVKANAGNLAMAGGAALVAFGAKAVGEFQSIALETGKLRDALGLTSEEASRYIEVAGDLGIGTDKIETSMGRMLVTAEKTPAALDAIGASLIRNADGTTNTSESFIHIVDQLNKIPDASQRAKAANDIFGRGWKDMAELIELGADGIRGALESVEGGKVIDDAEVERARAFRDALDELKGASEELFVLVGGKLVPVLTDLTEAFSTAQTAASRIGEIIPGPVATGFQILTDQLQRSMMPWKYVTDFMGEADTGGKQLGTTLNKLGTDVEVVGKGMGDLAKVVDEAASSQDLIAESIAAATEEVEAQNEALALADGMSKAWADGITAATDQGADGFGTFSEEAFASIDKFQDELAQSIVDTANWKTNLVTIAGQTSAEFATYLAELGPEAAGMVAELAGNTGELTETFDIWSMGAASASRDMVEEFQNVDPAIQAALAGTAGTLKAVGTQIGDALADGVADGLRAGIPAVEKAAADVVNKAASAAKLAGLIKSPSRVMAEQVGKPLAQGIAEGILEDADKISDSLTKSIESSTKDAIKAAEKLVSDVQGEVSDLWGGIDDDRTEDDLRDAVKDANEALKEAVASGDVDKIADAKERLEDANYRLAKATVDMITADGQSRESWKKTAEAAGLTGTEINALIAKYDALAQAQVNSAKAISAIDIDAAKKSQVVGRFNGVVANGLVSAAELDELGGLDPTAQLDWIKNKLNNLDRLFGVVPQYAKGGVVPGPPSQGTLAMVHGGETIIPAGAGSGGSTVININMPPGSNGNDVVRALREHVRKNGPIQGIT